MVPSPADSNPQSFLEHTLEGFVSIDAAVFPSTDRTISVRPDDTYGGAHEYAIQHSLGFNNATGKAETGEGYTILKFVHKPADGGPMEEGLQNEQLAYVMIDRLQKMNAKFPSPHNEKQLAGLQMYLDGCRERVEERMGRGVMGALKQ